MDFNPRSHERSDGIPDSTIYDWGKFQSTLPREERPTRTSFFPVCDNFNPRSHERSDLTIDGCCSNLRFQSTLPREERLCNSAWFLVAQHISIHAPTRGATWGCFCDYIIFRFQSTLPREERQCQRIINMVLGYFNPRSHERSD